MFAESCAHLRCVFDGLDFFDTLADPGIDERDGAGQNDARAGDGVGERRLQAVGPHTGAHTQGVGQRQLGVGVDHSQQKAHSNLVMTHKLHQQICTFSTFDKSHKP